MRIETTNVELMKQIMNAISTIVDYDEVYINIQDRGVSFQSVAGPGHHIVHVEVPKSEFEHYDAGENHILHINVNDMADIVKLSKVGDNIIFEVVDGEFKIKIDGDKIFNETVFGLLGEEGVGTGYRSINISGYVLASNSTIESDLFILAIKTANFGDGLITFVHDKTGLEVTTQNDAMTKKNRTRIIYSDDNSEDILFHETITNKKGKTISYEPIHTSSYDLDNVKTITKFIRAGTTIKFSMSDTGPMRIVLYMGKTIFAVSFMPIIEVQ